VFKTIFSHLLVEFDRAPQGKDKQKTVNVNFLRIHAAEMTEGGLQCNRFAPQIFFLLFVFLRDFGRSNVSSSGEFNPENLFVLRNGLSIPNTRHYGWDSSCDDTRIPATLGMLHSCAKQEIVLILSDSLYRTNTASIAFFRTFLTYVRIISVLTLDLV